MKTVKNTAVIIRDSSDYNFILGIVKVTGLWDANRLQEVANKIMYDVYAGEDGDYEYDGQCFEVFTERLAKYLGIDSRKVEVLHNVDVLL